MFERFPFEISRDLTKAVARMNGTSSARLPPKDQAKVSGRTLARMVKKFTGVEGAPLGQTIPDMLVLTKLVVLQT